MLQQITGAIRSRSANVAGTTSSYETGAVPRLPKERSSSVLATGNEEEISPSSGRVNLVQLKEIMRIYGEETKTEPSSAAESVTKLLAQKFNVDPELLRKVLLHMQLPEAPEGGGVTFQKKSG